MPECDVEKNSGKTGCIDRNTQYVVANLHTVNVHLVALCERPLNIFNVQLRV